MANLDVQRKRSGSGWLWLLLAAAAIIILFFVFKGRSSAPDKTRGTDTLANARVVAFTDAGVKQEPEHIVFFFFNLNLKPVSMDYDQTTIGQGSAYAQLQELGSSDYEIKDGEPDISGWVVTSEDGNRLGQVSELLFDPKAMKVRYIVLAVHNTADGSDSDRRVLIPVGVAQLHEQDDEVVLTGITSEQVGQLSAYEGWAKLTAEVESNDRLVWAPGDSEAYQYPQFYEHAHFDEDRFYNRRSQIGARVPEDNIDLDDVAGPADNRDKAHRIVERITGKNSGQ